MVLLVNALLCVRLHFQNILGTPGEAGHRQAVLGWPGELLKVAVARIPDRSCLEHSVSWMWQLGVKGYTLAKGPHSRLRLRLRWLLQARPLESRISPGLCYTEAKSSLSTIRALDT